jgi:hypothetical protein
MPLYRSDFVDRRLLQNGFLEISVCVLSLGLHLMEGHTCIPLWRGSTRCRQGNLNIQVQVLAVITLNELKDSEAS